MIDKLRLQHVAHSFGARSILVDVSLTIAAGEIVGILGPNGAGKTSLFYIIIGFLIPNRGHLYLNEQELTHMPVHLRSKVGIAYLPQEQSIFQKLTVADNLMALLEMRADLTCNQRLEKLEFLLSQFQIQHLRNEYGMSLSGGERRRTEIARALTMDPKFILLDEPFAGVDPIAIIEIKKIIKQLQKKGIAVLITDHNVRDTLDICDRAYILDNGHVIAEGAAQDIIVDTRVKQAYLGQNFTL